MTNEELTGVVSGIAKKDREALRQLYMGFRVPIQIIIYRMTHDRGVSEKLTQEVFVRLWHCLAGSENPRVTIYSVVRQVAAEHIKTLKTDTLSDPDEEPDLKEFDDLTEIDIEIELALLQLLSEDRDIVIFHVTGGLSLEEVAVVMELPEKTVKARYKKAMHDIRYFLTEMK